MANSYTLKGFVRTTLIITKKVNLFFFLLNLRHTIRNKDIDTFKRYDIMKFPVALDDFKIQSFTGSMNKRTQIS